jgi:phage baseplate assembly protein W
MSTRADRFTQLQKVPDLFSDFLTDLTPHPITKDVMRIRNDASVKQSIKNLIMTNYSERPFQPTIGCNIYGSLFEPNDRFFFDNIESSIRNTIQYNEPRATILDVRVQALSDAHSVGVSVLFALINSMEPQSLDIILRRVR